MSLFDLKGAVDEMSDVTVYHRSWASNKMIVDSCISNFIPDSEFKVLWCAN